MTTEETATQDTRAAVLSDEYAPAEQGNHPMPPREEIDQAKESIRNVVRSARKKRESAAAIELEMSDSLDEVLHEASEVFTYKHLASLAGCSETDVSTRIQRHRKANNIKTSDDE